MKHNCKILFLAISVACCSWNACEAQNYAGRLDSLFKDVSATSYFSGTVLVSDHGKVQYQNSKGYSDITNHRLNTGFSRFQLASVSKLFTATAIMQLVDKGKLKLDDSLAKYLRTFPYPNITIRQLLSHTSGLPDFRDVYRIKSDHPLKNSDIIPDLVKFGHLLAPPGTQWNYSSMGYGLLAILVEQISGLSFPSYVNKFICKPSGMMHSYVLDPYQQYPDSLRAISYFPSGGDSLTVSDSVQTDLANPFQTIIGPGLMVSSAEDLLLFSEALYKNVILSKESQDEMYTPVKLADGSFAELRNAPLYAGLGWAIDIDHSSGTIVSHNGGSRGISTILIRNLQKHQTVIVLENSDNSGIFSFGINAMNIINNRPTRHFF
jgi:CubicO group peptidase (beta-lactamase class C family)